MTAKTIERLWQEYPESHLHCDVTKAGLHTYSIVASLILSGGETLASVEYVGSGELETLKARAYELLASELGMAVDV